MAKEFHKLFEAYDKRCVGHLHPTILVVNPDWDEEFRIRFEKREGLPWTQFNDAKVLVDPNEPDFRFIGGFEESI